MNQLMILNNEFADYFYGSIIPDHQAYPVVLNGGNLITIEHNSFENNEGYNIRTGFDGQNETTHLTQNLLIRSNDFKPVTDDRDLTHIRLHQVLHVTIQSNHFEATTVHDGVFVAIEQGTLDNDANITCLNNGWHTSLDEKMTGTAPYTWIEEGEITIKNNQ
jgi:hypothetical protein